MVKYSFVIPAYNEEKNIVLIYEKINQLMIKTDGSWELIFVNDGSLDNTISSLNDLSIKDKRVKYISLSRNFGHQAALTAGLNHASGEAIISMDCDLQDPPEVVEELITKWKEGFDIVYARRLNFRRDNFLKKILSKIYYQTLGKVSDVRIPPNVGDFRLISKKVLTEIKKFPEHSRYLRGIVAWMGFNHTFVDYQRPDREFGKSSYSFHKLTSLAISGLMNFSVLPLRFGLFLGIFSIFSGCALLFYQIIDSLVNNAYYHLYKWLVVVIFIFLGFIFMLMWIIGEYIGKIYDEVRQRPIYLINEKVNFDADIDAK
jgi:polyisoprenyl-phosphate glycosyltransferase